MMGKGVVYKPKSLKSDIIWNKVIEWQNSKEKIRELRGIKTIDCGTYGWQEKIDSVLENPSSNINVIYKRIGALLCMAYLCGMTDIHMENIIINQDMPYIVDTETLFNYEKISEKGVRKWVLQSVLSTQMLPVLYGSNITSCDVAGITGGSKKIKIRKQILKEVEQNKVKVVWDEKEKTDIGNIPKVRYKYIEPRNYLKSIIEGFKEEYVLVLEWKSELMELFKSSIMESYRSRIIYRNTNSYQSLLSLLQNPRYLLNKTDSENLLEVLKLNKKIPLAIAKKEIDNLQSGDIPYFTIDLQNRVFNAEEYIYTEEKRENIYKRIMNYSEEDMRKQIFLIRMSMALPENSQIKKCIYKQELPERKIHAEVYHLAAKLKHDAFINYQDSIVEWINIVNAYPSWGISEQGLDLYFGLPGNAIFLAALHKITQSQEDLLYLQLVLNSIEQKRKAVVYKDFSLFSGKTSLIYMYAVLSTLLGKKYNRDLERVCDELLGEVTIAELEDDIVNGISGVLIGFCCAYTVLKKDRYYKVIEKLAMKIVERIRNHTEKEISDMGVAHGYAGTLLALSKAYLITKKKLYMDTIFLVEKEISLDNGKLDISWCHGLVGLGLVYIGLGKLLGRGVYKEKIKKCEEKIRNRVWENSDCLCHGNMGTVDFYIEYSQYQNETIFMEYAKKIISYCLLKHKKWHCGCKQDIIVYGIMTGISGIGYELLRVLYPNELPNILLLEI